MIPSPVQLDSIQKGWRNNKHDGTVNGRIRRVRRNWKIPAHCPGVSECKLNPVRSGQLMWTFALIALFSLQSTGERLIIEVFCWLIEKFPSSEHLIGCRCAGDIAGRISIRYSALVLTFGCQHFCHIECLSQEIHLSADFRKNLFENSGWSAIET